MLFWRSEKGAWGYFEFDKGALVVIDVAVVGCREDCDNRREVLLAVPLVHFVAFNLGLMRADQRKELVSIHELVHRFDAGKKG